MNRCCKELPMTPMVAQLSLSFDNDISIVNSIRAIEKAYWDYIDNYRTSKYYKFKEFLEIIIRAYNPDDVERVPVFMRQYSKYKKSIATDGVIFFTRDNGLKFIVVKINGSKIWSMPKGKRETGETSVNCAIREFKEETGIDIRDCMTSDIKRIQIQRTNFFIMESDYAFMLRTHKTNEISQIKWANISEILNNKDLYSKQTYQSANYINNQDKHSSGESSALISGL